MSRAMRFVSHACGHATPTRYASATTSLPCAGCQLAIGPRQVGGSYHCGYWGQDYTVEAIRLGEQYLGGWEIVVRWDAEPGRPAHSTTHATAWEPKRDRVIAEGPIS